MNRVTDPLPYALAIHTTTPQLGLCCCHPKMGLMTQTWDLERQMSTQLHDTLAAFVHPYGFEALTFIAVAIGPGGFTSTRLGVVTARTLAQQLNIPLFGISSLAVCAWHHVSTTPSVESNKHPVSSIAVYMPARRDQVFGAIYDITYDPLTSKPLHLTTNLADHVCAQLHWSERLSNITQPIQAIAIDRAIGHTVSSLLALALEAYQDGQTPHWSTVYPFYGQSPV